MPSSNESNGTSPHDNASASATADHPTLSVLTHDPQLPINEIADFYSIAHCKPHLDANPPRPYIWCNSLVTLDGYLSYHEPGDTGVHGVAMKKWYPKLSSVDFRMLHSGWSHSDAILITASELRNEPQAQIRVLFDDLIAYRQQVLHKPAQPYLVILTRSGDIPATHPVFNPPQDKPLHARYPILIVTTTQGKQRLPLDVLAGQLNPPQVVTFDDPQSSGVCFASLFAYLVTHCKVHQVDCGTGGDVIQQLIVAKYIDEMRMTLAAQLAGGWTQALTRRPHFFPVAKDNDAKCLFTADTAPHLQIEGVRVAGKRLVFLRMKVEYRH